jgi:signal transduction histidine kinase
MTIAVKCRIPHSGLRLSSTAELNLFRVVQEALANVEQHAAAKNVNLRLTRRKGGVVLQVQDDGRGFDPRSVRARDRGRSGVGLESIRDRARLLGGACEVSSSPQRGTMITIRIPAGAPALAPAPSRA